MTEDTRIVRILSHGMGVQTVTIDRMIAHGELDPIDYAIFGDPQKESELTYEYKRWLLSGNVTRSFPIIDVTAGSIVENIEGGMLRGDRWATIPAWVKGPDGREAPLTRQCTTEFKIEPIHAKIREIIGLKPGQSFRHAWGLGPKDAVPIRVENWIGISWDERERESNNSGHEWIKLRYPLLEKRMTRQDCERWLTKNGYPIPPKSACIFCPYTENERWRRMRDERPEEWAEACRIDRIIGNGHPGSATRAPTQPMFLHRSLRRLDEVDLTDLFYDAGGMKNECMGGCGT